MTFERAPIAVIGATGQQGRAVVSSLLASEQQVRAVVRDVHSPAARSLQAHGVEIVAADQNDPESLGAALTGISSLFFMTTFDGPEGTNGEVARGKAVAEAAARVGVPRVVYSSVGGAERATGVPHFESKRLVELRLSELLPVKFIRPTFFMDNITPQLSSNWDDDVAIYLPVAGDVPIQMVSVRDIGSAAAEVLIREEALNGESIELVGDELTMEQVAVRIGEAYSRPVRYEALPLEILGGDDDLKAMFEWFSTSPAYQGDFSATRQLVPDVRDLRAWLQESAAAMEPTAR